MGSFAPDAAVIHVDIDPAELGKVRRPDVPIVGDCKLVIESLVKAVKRELEKRRGRPTAAPGTPASPSGGARFPYRYEQEDGGPLKPQYCIEQIRDHAPSDAIVVAGVGQHQMWAAQFWRFNHPYTWINSGGLGTMGFAVPAAIGAKVGMPGRARCGRSTATAASR